MSAATLEKPAARRARPVQTTLAKATDAAMTELSKAIDLMVSAQRAAEDGHHLCRALRVAEEMALEIMGWMDHGQRGPGEWMNRMFDCQAVLRCAALDPSEPASTLAASQAAEAVDRATAVLDQSSAGEVPRAAATVEPPAMAEDLGARRRLAFNAYYQQSDLISGLKELLEEASKHPGLKNGQMHVGIVSRIELLANIIFHAARLDGDDGTGWAHWDELGNLQRAFDGGLA